MPGSVGTHKATAERCSGGDVHGTPRQWHGLPFCLSEGLQMRDAAPGRTGGSRGREPECAAPWLDRGDVEEGEPDSGRVEKQL